MADTVYVDDPTITNDAVLWRRVHPKWVVPDDNGDGVRVSSAAFDDSADGTPLSVLIAETMTAGGRGPNDAIAGFDGYALASITAGNAREQEQVVARTPILDEPAHGSIFGKKTKTTKRAMAKTARWVIAPTDSRA